MQVLETIPLGRLDRNGLLRLAGHLEQWAVHPVAQALAMAAAPLLKRAAAAEVHAYREVAGSGVEAVVDGVPLRIGTLEFAQALHGLALPPAVAARLPAGTLAAVADSAGWLGIFALGDGVRAQARELAAALQRAGCRVTLLTGDNPEVAARVGAELGISDVQSAMSPDAKRDWVAQLQRQGAVVAMIGDGINDAPVLAQAHVSIAMGSGAPLAQARSDMVLMSAAPADLWHARQVARKTLAIVRQNLAWAVAYNLVAVPLAVSGMLTPLLAGIGMSLSSLIVVANSLRLLPRGRRAAPEAPALLFGEAA
jgi:Cu2+-exporting ATPase